jgi:hypothetical protein
LEYKKPQYCKIFGLDRNNIKHATQAYEQKQLESEIKELIEIFGEDRTKWPSVFQRKFGINKE